VGTGEQGRDGHHGVRLLGCAEAQVALRFFLLIPECVDLRARPVDERAEELQAGGAEQDLGLVRRVQRPRPVAEREAGARKPRQRPQ
jgi:hypothetical protein